MSSFFDFFRNSQSNQPAPSDATTSSEPVVLFVTPGNEVTIPADEARNSTLGELFQRYAEVLGIDPEQVSRYSDAGRIVERTALPVPGRIYQASANSFTKG